MRKRINKGRRSSEDVMERRRPPLFSLVLLTAVAVSISSGSLNAVAATGVKAPTDDFIRSSCKKTRYPDVCEQSLASYAPTVRRSHRQLAVMALSVSADRARSVSTFVTRMTAGAKSIRSREAGAVRDCIETMRDSVDRLRQSIQEMRQMGRARSSRFAWHFSNVQTWCSAALTDETTCLDSLSQNAGPAVRSAIRKKMVEVAQVTSNALALVNLLDPKH